MVTFLRLTYCEVFCILWCVSHILWWVLSIMMCCLYCNKCSCCTLYKLWVVGHVRDLYVSKRPAQAHTTHHTLLHFHMSARYSVPDVLPRTPGVMPVYPRCYTRITLGVMLWCKDGSYMYLGIMSYMAVSHMICMSYICHMLLSTVSCSSCYSFPAK